MASTTHIAKDVLDFPVKVKQNATLPPRMPLEHRMRGSKLELLPSSKSKRYDVPYIAGITTTLDMLRRYDLLDFPHKRNDEQGLWEHPRPRPLARTLFGKVYLAYDRLRDQQVVIKMSCMFLAMQKVTTRGSRVVENVQNEAVNMKLLHQDQQDKEEEERGQEVIRSGAPYLAKVLDEYFLIDPMQCHPRIPSIPRTFQWMIMPYYYNGEMFHALAHPLLGPKISTETTSNMYMRQLLLALHHMHKKGICHLDMSIENILLDGMMNAIICDFGVSRSFRPGPGVRDGMFDGLPDIKPGKLRTMAPEVLAGERFDGCKADVFSLGVIMFMLLTRTSPFECAAPNICRRYQWLVNGRLADLLALYPTMRFSDAAQDMMNAMLKHDPRERATVRTLMDHPWMTHNGADPEWYLEKPATVLTEPPKVETAIAVQPESFDALGALSPGSSPPVSPSSQCSAIAASSCLSSSGSDMDCDDTDTVLELPSRSSTPNTTIVPC